MLARAHSHITYDLCHLSVAIVAVQRWVIDRYYYTLSVMSLHRMTVQWWIDKVVFLSSNRLSRHVQRMSLFPLAAMCSPTSTLYKCANLDSVPSAYTITGCLCDSDVFIYGCRLSIVINKKETHSRVHQNSMQMDKIFQLELLYRPESEREIIN